MALFCDVNHLLRTVYAAHVKTDLAEAVQMPARSTADIQQRFSPGPVLFNYPGNKIRLGGVIFVLVENIVILRIV